ncbi:hypothetical protein HanIR_Chr10g0482561 [Helianthus annuus]|nr:hypothetical protein HanIR_Chr10g0482561 [Helianthus annuus]
MMCLVNGIVRGGGGVKISQSVINYQFHYFLFDHMVIYYYCLFCSFHVSRIAGLKSRYGLKLLCTFTGLKSRYGLEIWAEVVMRI